jgi:hypothetical protein
MLIIMFMKIYIYNYVYIIMFIKGMFIKGMFIIMFINTSIIAK